MDLNLYPVFREIMRHGSVSKAANALGLTQPATSNALTRLRAQMGDPLFVRTRGGMLPTHYAKDILAEIEQSLDTLANLPADAPAALPLVADLNRHFTAVMSDLEETLFLPELIGQMAIAAPGTSIEVRQFHRGQLGKSLETGRVDFVMAHLTAPVKNLVSRTLAAQEFVCVARRGHPAMKKGPLTLGIYTSHGHILVAPDQGGRRGVVDEQLKRMGERRRVVCSVPHFLSACGLAAGSDHLLTVPHSLGEKMAAKFHLKIHALPFSMPGFSIGLHWHRIRDRDPEHGSFRNFILDLFQPIAPR